MPPTQLHPHQLSRFKSEHQPRPLHVSSSVPCLLKLGKAGLAGPWSLQGLSRLGHQLLAIGSTNSLNQPAQPLRRCLLLCLCVPRRLLPPLWRRPMWGHRSET